MCVRVQLPQITIRIWNVVFLSLVHSTRWLHSSFFFFLTFFLFSVCIKDAHLGSSKITVVSLGLVFPRFPNLSSNCSNAQSGFTSRSELFRTDNALSLNISRCLEMKACRFKNSRGGFPLTCTAFFFMVTFLWVHFFH